MGLRDQMTADLQAQFANIEGAAEDGVYEGAVIRVFADEPQEAISFQEDGKVEKQEMRVYVLASEVATPARGDSMTFRSKVWFVKRAHSDTAPGMHTLDIGITTIAEKSQRDYRVQR